MNGTEFDAFCASANIVRNSLNLGDEAIAAAMKRTVQYPRALLDLDLNSPVLALLLLCST
jgi:hypothetical protein